MNERRRPTFVVPRANDVCYLGILRGLVRAGADVVPVVWSWAGARPFWSDASRHHRGVVSMPNPATDPEDAVAALRELGARLLAETGERPVIVPSSDTVMMLVLDHYDGDLDGYYRVMGRGDFDGAPHEVVDKASCAAILNRAGCPVPLTRGVRSPGDVPAAVADVPVPAVYKPAVKDYGMRFYARHDGSKAVAVDDPEALGRGLTQAVADGFPLVAQERVPFRGPEDEVPFYAYVDASGRVRLAATAIKRSIYPAPFGTATVLELAWHPELVPVAEGVARALRYRGILMIELIRDARDGRFRVIEVNPRPWLFIGFFVAAGLDFLGYLVDDVDGRLDERRPSTLVHPSPGALAAPPVHVDLADEWAALEARLGGAVPETAFLEHLAGIPGRLSATWDDPDDPGPGDRRLADLAARRGLRPSDLNAMTTLVRSHWPRRPPHPPADVEPVAARP